MARRRRRTTTTRRRRRNSHGSHDKTAKEKIMIKYYCQSPLRLDYGRSPHAYVNQRLKYS
jgi:hypothetical protein